MPVITPSSILSDVVLENTSILPMLNRFGIKLGLGDATVQEVCNAHGIDMSFFLHIANSYLQPGYTGRLKLSPGHISLVVDYLESANNYYLHSQLPNVRVHLLSFVKRSGGDSPIIESIPRILAKLEETLQERINRDQEELFPKFRTLALQLGADIQTLTLEHRTPVHDEDGDRLENIVADVMQVLIRHIRGNFDDNLLHGVIYSLQMLRNDLSSNNRLRRRVFVPMLAAMQEQLDKTARG